MNLSGIKSYVSTHGKQVGLGTAGAGVAGYALIVKRRKAAAAAAVGTTGAAGTTGTGAAVAGLTAAPNTQASDIENYVQDQINGFQNDINAQLGTVPAAAAVAGSGGYSYIRDASTSAIYSVDKVTGVRTHLSAADYAVAGNPAYTSYNTSPPKPKVAAAAPKPGSKGYSYLNEGGAVYQLDKATGVQKHLAPAQYAAVGKPKLTVVK